MTDHARAPARVGAVPLALGYAGLLPQAAAVAVILFGRRDPSDLASISLTIGVALAVAYGGLILSFLGGIWWGFAMRRARRQGALAAAAVVPSLVALAVTIAMVATLPDAPSGWPLVVLGSAIITTLPVDRHLVATGEAPANWMALRVPLSLGLGALTIVAGALIG